MEINLKATQIIEGNLLKLSIYDQGEIIRNKIESIKNWKRKYNIFFLDPPFKDLEFIKNKKNLQNQKVYKKKHVVIIHREKNSTDNYNDLLNIFKIKIYGRSKIIFANFR